MQLEINLNKKHKSGYEKAFLHQISNFELKSNKNIKFYNENGDSISFEHFIKGGMIGLYFSKNNCHSCIDRSIDIFKEEVTKLRFTKSAFIAADKEEYSYREAKLLGKKNSLHTVFVNFREDSLMTQLINERKPFFFIINDDAVISSVFFIESDLDDNVIKKGVSYIIGQAHFANKSSFISPSSSKADTISNDCLEMSDINLGNLKSRRVKEFFIKVKNNTSSNCIVEQILPSCDCITIEMQSKLAVKAHAEVLIPAKILRTDKGAFQVNIYIKSNKQKIPTKIGVSGVVK